MSEQRRDHRVRILAKKEKGRIQFEAGSHPTRMLVVAAPTLCAWHGKANAKVEWNYRFQRRADAVVQP